MLAWYNRTNQYKLWRKKHSLPGSEGRQNDQLYSHGKIVLKVSRQKEEVTDLRGQSSLRSPFWNFERGLQLHWGGNVSKLSQSGYKEERGRWDWRRVGFFFNFEGVESRETFWRDEVICENLDVF